MSVRLLLSFNPLKPALIGLGHEVERAGLPIMRPMSMEFPQDDRFAATDDQYMLGPDMLVAPVLEEGHVGRAVKFPAGVWQHALAAGEAAAGQPKRAKSMAAVNRRHTPDQDQVYCS